MKRLLLLAILAACGDSPAPADAPVNLPPRTTLDGGAADAAPDAAIAPECPAGATLVRKVSCDGTTTTAPASVSLEGARGSLTSIAGFAEPTAPCLPANVCAPDDAPTLFFSDSPEMPATDGVLYADTLPAGRHRIYDYHANGDAGSARKFPVVVLNQNDAAATITILRRGLTAPGTDYLAVGKEVARLWLDPRAPTTVTVPAGKRVLLDPGLDALHAGTNALVNAIYDITIDAPLKVSVVSVRANVDAVAATAGLSLLPRDRDHQRGTFPKADLLLRGTPPVGVSRLRLGDGSVDPILVGRDATVGDEQRLKGNYGLLYRIALDGGAAGITARGGAWEGAATFDGGKPVALPTEGVVRGTDAVVLGSALEDVRLFTGGSASLPIDLFVIRTSR